MIMIVNRLPVQKLRYYYDCLAAILGSFCGQPISSQ
jgi:hypothetical protein